MLIQRGVIDQHVMTSRAVFWLTCVSLFATPSLLAQRVGPPPTRTDDVRDTIHGVEVVDPYRWLEDQQSPETRAWIDAQNQYTESVLGELPGRESIRERLTELLQIDVMLPPVARKGRYFFSKRLANQDLFVIYMREAIDGEDQVLIDPHAMSEDHRTSVNMLDVSEDGTILIYGIREGGEDEVVVRFLQVDRKQDLPDYLPKGRYFGVSLKPDNSGFYYSHFNPEIGSRLYYHEMGTDPSNDVEIFGEGFGPGQIVTGGLSEDGRYLGIIVLHGAGASKTELYFKDLEEDSPIQTIVNNIDAKFFPSLAGDQLIIHTDWEASNGRIMRASIENLSPDHWEEIVPETSDVIRGVSLAGGKVFVNYLHDVQSRVSIFNVDGDHKGDIAFPTIGTVSGIAGRWSSNEAFFAFSSFHVPTTFYRYDVASGDQEVWARIDVPIESDNFEVKQVWYESKDGTRLPMFIVHAPGLELNGQNPTLLTGYGGFNISLTPGFSARAAFWVERGGVYAVPNLRGGGEFGEEWHRAGMRENKQNVFDDFIAAAEWLIEHEYTNRSKLAIRGGSNGGLLVGAAMTQRPELFQAVVCTYPLLDMVRYHKFLVARFWIPEYGSSDDPEQFRYIHRYSPYHRVVAGTEFPSTLFISGDSDTRVAPLHARKMAALVQASTGSDRPVLVKYDTKSGHSGGTPVSRQIEDLTDSMSFLFWQLGLIAPQSMN